MNLLLIYHFFYPDPVISARLFSDLAAELAQAGHRVTVFTGNRLIRSDTLLPLHEEWSGVSIERFPRPNFSQGSNFGRLFNSGILQFKWLMAFWGRRKEFDGVIVGTDPQFSYLMFPFLRLMNHNVRLIHWVFDLYPEAILANSPKWMKLLAALTKPFIPWAYRRVDVMVDIGQCMRERLLKYCHEVECVTLPPWALVEPKQVPVANPEIRHNLFGDAKLGLLYSGTVGYAHDLGPFIQLARECRRQGIDAAFCFAGYGNRYQAQTAQITVEDTNIRLAEFASEEELERRLATADIHLISLREKWEGIVVPSKFFGALAIGRPVLFSGSNESCIAKWCNKYKIGFTINMPIIEILEDLILHSEKLTELQQHSYQIYQRKFSKYVICNRWIQLLNYYNRNSKNIESGQEVTSKNT